MPKSPKKWIQWYFFSATLTLLAFIIDQSADIIWILLKSGVGDSVSAFYKGGISGHLLSMELICYTAPDQRDPFKKVSSQSKQGSANAKSMICIHSKTKMSKRGKIQLSAIHLNFSELDYLTIILILLPCDQERIHKFKCLNESTITIIVRGVQYQYFPVKPTMILTQVQRWRFSLIHSLENYCRVDKGNRTRKGGLHYSPTERNPKIKYTRSRWTKKVLFFGCPNLF